MLLPLGKLIRHRRTPWRGAKVSQRLQREWSPQKRQDQSTCGENQRAETKTSSAAKKWQFDLTIKIAKHLWIGQLWAAHPKKIFKRIRDNLSPRHQLPHPLQSPVLLPRPFLGLRLRPSSPGKLEMVQWLGSLKGSSSLELTPKINRTIFKKIWWPKKPCIQVLPAIPLNSQWGAWNHLCQAQDKTPLPRGSTGTIIASDWTDQRPQCWELLQWVRFPPWYPM